MDKTNLTLSRSGIYSGSVVKTKTLGFFNESLAC